MSDWDDSESETEQQPTASPDKEAVDEWDASASSDDDAPTDKKENKKEDNKEENEEQKEEQNEPIKHTQDTVDKEAADQEALKKMKKKLQNYKKKKKAKKKNQRKSKKKQPPPKQNSVPKNQNEVIEMSSSDSSDDGQNNNKKKMETYEERMRTDNDILFEGHKVAKQKQKQKQKPKQKQTQKQIEKDERPMLSGEVTLKNFPLGSSRDCENLAQQIAGAMDEALYRDHIKASDVFVFYKQLLSSSILEKFDMVETKELATKMNALLAGKQKAWHIKKNPKGKAKKKPQWLAGKGKKFDAQRHKGAYVEGQYEQDEYSLFD